MKKYKLVEDHSDRNKVIAVFIGTFLALSLINFPNKQNANMENQQKAEKIEKKYEKEIEEKTEETITEEIEAANEQPKHISSEETEATENENLKQADEVIDEYIITLKDGFNELKNYTKDKWNSEEFQEKLTISKQRLKDLLDFVFNGKEIKGITFNDLSTEAKKEVVESLVELDSWIEKLFPEYKERLYEWLVRRGTDGIEIWNNLKEDFFNYKEDVLEEYSGRSTTSLIRLKKVR